MSDTEGEIEEIVDDNESIVDTSSEISEETGIIEAMGALLANDEGETVCTALLNIGKQIETQNKILIKIVSVLREKLN